MAGDVMKEKLNRAQEMLRIAARQRDSSAKTSACGCRNTATWCTKWRQRVACVELPHGFPLWHVLNRVHDDCEIMPLFLSGSSCMQTIRQTAVLT